MENENPRHDHRHAGDERRFYHDDAERDLRPVRDSCLRVGVPYCLFYIWAITVCSILLITMDI